MLLREIQENSGNTDENEMKEMLTKMTLLPRPQESNRLKT